VEEAKARVKAVVTVVTFALSGRLGQGSGELRDGRVLLLVLLVLL
jgi:hypothetical protein